jgi:hypothetical protein
MPCASCDVNENYSYATGKKLFDIELEHCLASCLAANYDNVRWKFAELSFHR